MSRTVLLSLSGLLMAGAAFAQTPRPHLSPEELDRLSAERQQEIGPRNWGPPVSPTSAENLVPVPVAVHCMTAVKDYVPIYASPSLDSKRIGMAVGEVAATDTDSNGWTKILRVGKTFAWMPSASVEPYHPQFSGGPSHCVVAGERPNGVVVFRPTA